MKKNVEDITREIRLVEYQKAQDSAEHHNTIMWTLINVGIGFSLTILYLVWTQSLNILTKLVFLFTGTFVLFYFSFIIEKTNETKNLKYNICKRIEKDYNFIGQNRLTENLKVSKMFKGMLIFRSMKILLWIFYSILIISYSIIGFKDFNFIFLIGFIMNILAILGSIIAEIIYRKYSS